MIWGWGCANSAQYIDVLQLSPSGGTLEWIEGVNILPEGSDCNLYWADEVRLSPGADVLFGSTRGLDGDTKGYIAAWHLEVNGQFTKAGERSETCLHRLETQTSGGWANAIAVCPELGPRGEVYLSLTDSAEGSVEILAYHRDIGFRVVDELKLGATTENGGASVTVWL